MSSCFCCCSNEALKVIKEEAKQKEWAADKAIMEEYAAQLDKQEAARRAQVSCCSSNMLHTVLPCCQPESFIAVEIEYVRAACCVFH